MVGGGVFIVSQVPYRGLHERGGGRANSPNGHHRNEKNLLYKICRLNVVRFQVSTSDI